MDSIFPVTTVEALASLVAASVKTVPLWVTLVVGLGAGLLSGALGAIAATLLSTRHDRSEQWRSRLVVAADDFAVAARRSFVAIRSLRSTIINSKNNATRFPLNEEQLDTSLEEVRVAVDEAHLHFARLQILFGNGSDATASAQTFVGDALEFVVYPQRGLDAIEEKRLTELYAACSTSYNKFLADVHRELRSARP